MASRPLAEGAATHREILRGLIGYLSLAEKLGVGSVDLSRVLVAFGQGFWGKTRPHRPSEAVILAFLRRQGRF